MKTRTIVILAVPTLIALWLHFSANIAGANRVAAARERVGPKVVAYFEKVGLTYPPSDLLFRAFKKEGELEIWSRAGKRDPYRLVVVFPILTASGVLGPKRREGDYQVPEGFYHIDRFNPKSLFHLSMGINYPNAEDRGMSDPVRPGSDIFIHGGEMTVGCLPMGDANVEEIYVMAWDTHRAGHEVRVHLFPCRFTAENWRGYLRPYAAAFGRPDLLFFWKRLEARQVTLKPTGTKL